MASIFQSCAILLLVSFMAVVDARPCKTLFISSYSFSLHHSENPNSLHKLPNPSGFVAVFTGITQLREPSLSSPRFFIVPRRFFPSSSDDNEEVDVEVKEESTYNYRNPHQPQVRTDLPLGFSYDFTSLRDRTKDILSVVVALLFGVGCGALTAATMYLAYSLFSNRSSVFDGYGDDNDDYDDDSTDSDLKKMGYVKIPTESAPAPAKAV